MDYDCPTAATDGRSHGATGASATADCARAIRAHVWPLKTDHRGQARALAGDEHDHWGLGARTQSPMDGYGRSSW